MAMKSTAKKKFQDITFRFTAKDADGSTATFEWGVFKCVDTGRYFLKMEQNGSGKFDLNPAGPTLGKATQHARACRDSLADIWRKDTDTVKTEDLIF